MRTRSGVSVRSVPVGSWTVDKRARSDGWRELLWGRYDGVGWRHWLSRSVSDVLARLPRSLPGSCTGHVRLYVRQRRYRRRSVHRLVTTEQRRDSLWVRMAGDYVFCTWITSFSTLIYRQRVVDCHFLPRDAMHKRGLCRSAVSFCLSVCPSRSRILSKRINILKNFSPSGSHTILVFPYQTL